MGWSPPKARLALPGVFSQTSRRLSAMWMSTRFLSTSHSSANKSQRPRKTHTASGADLVPSTEEKVKVKFGVNQHRIATLLYILGVFTVAEA